MRYAYYNFFRPLFKEFYNDIGKVVDIPNHDMYNTFVILCYYPIYYLRRGLL